MTIYHVDAEDPMNSSMSCDRFTLGYYKRKEQAQDEVERYNKNKRFMLARINEIEVIE